MPAETAAPVAGGPSAGGPSVGAPATGLPAAQVAALKNAPRVKIDAPAVRGSISLLGARLDDMVLNDYRDTIQPNSPNVKLLQPLAGPDPYYVQFGWSAPEGQTARAARR